MTENQPEIEKLKVITGMQQSEASIHWARNNIFLICSSILLLAFSQFHQELFQISIAALGFVINLAWLLIQYRSSKYIHHWKSEARRIMADIYPPDLKGIEMRKVAFIFPIAFMTIWLAILIITIIKPN
jgi:hypothetical protein